MCYKRIRAVLYNLLIWYKNIQEMLKAVKLSVFILSMALGDLIGYNRLGNNVYSNRQMRNRVPLINYEHKIIKWMVKTGVEFPSVRNWQHNSSKLTGKQQKRLNQYKRKMHNAAWGSFFGPFLRVNMVSNLFHSVYQPSIIPLFYSLNNVNNFERFNAVHACTFYVVFLLINLKNLTHVFNFQCILFHK